MMSVLKVLACLHLSLLLIGCGTTSSVSVGQTSLLNNIQISLDDLRSPEQKKSHTDDENGLKNIYFGDDNFSPAPPDLFKSALYKRFGSALINKKIAITDFIVNVNEPVVRVNSADVQNAAATVPNGYAAAPLAELFINFIENVRSEKNVYIKISGTIDDKTFSSSSSQPFKGRVSESNIRQVLDASLNDALNQIQTHLESKSN